MRGAWRSLVVAVALLALPHVAVGQQADGGFTPAQLAERDRTLAAVEDDCRRNSVDERGRPMDGPSAYCACKLEELRRELTPQVYAREDRAEVVAITERIKARCLTRATRESMPRVCESSLRSGARGDPARADVHVAKVCGCFSRALDALDDAAIPAMLDATEAVAASGIRPDDPGADAIPAQSMQGMLMACGVAEAQRAIRAGKP